MKDPPLSFVIDLVIMACPEAAVQFLKFNCSQKDGAEHLQFDTLALHGIYGFSADDGTATCYLDVVDELQNRYGTLHGGCIGKLWLSVVPLASLWIQATLYKSQSLLGAHLYSVPYSLPSQQHLSMLWALLPCSPRSKGQG